MNPRNRRLVGGVALLFVLVLGVWGVEAWRREKASTQHPVNPRAWTFDPFSLRPDHDPDASGQPHLALHDPVHWGRNDKPQ